MIDDFAKWLSNYEIDNSNIFFYLTIIFLALAISGSTILSDVNEKFMNPFWNFVVVILIVLLLHRFPYDLHNAFFEEHGYLYSFFSDQNQIPLFFMIAVLAFWIRQGRPQIYAVVEIIIGTFAIIFSVISKNAALQSKVLGIVGGVYIIVRGLDNSTKSGFEFSEKDHIFDLKYYIYTIPQMYVRKNPFRFQMILLIVTTIAYFYYNGPYIIKKVLEGLAK